MDVRDFPMDWIMQLPDHCFGRRWPVSVGWPLSAAGTFYDISESGLPERCVIWEVLLNVISHGTNGLVVVNLALGDVLPTTAAEFQANEMLLRDFGWYNLAQFNITAGIGDQVSLRNLRVPVMAAGRRLIGRCISGAQGSDAFLSIVVSSMPTEVPDWLISGRA